MTKHHTIPISEPHRGINPRLLAKAMHWVYTTTAPLNSNTFKFCRNRETHCIDMIVQVAK